MSTPTAAAAACLSCRTTGGFALAGRAHPARTRGLCNRCKQHELRSGAYWERPLSPRQGEPTNRIIPAGIITPAMLGIKPGQPPTDPNLTPGMVWNIGNRNARKALAWLVARGMAHDTARHLATWQPAEVSTTGDADRRAA